ncbi:hypothetical protein ASZ90_009031 [hydrocarbon metagenome]|uniref:Uncharacterized protein n=1 Tax=hydrocarbon metagenome TaxID=938273 RepID=A0A0W8FJZ4_9ZZZZ
MGGTAICSAPDPRSGRTLKRISQARWITGDFPAFHRSYGQARAHRTLLKEMKCSVPIAWQCTGF